MENYVDSNRVNYSFNMCKELHEIDTNCNTCMFLERDFEKFKYWEEINRQHQLKDFENMKKSELNIANTLPDEKGRNKLINRVNKMKFYFDKSGLLSYGKCSKTNSDISFISNICMPQNNNCYKIR